MRPNHTKNGEKALKRQSNRIKMLISIIIMLAILVIFVYIKTNDTPKKSKVDGISDEVYEQLVQFYFYTITFMEMMLEQQAGDGNLDPDWMEDHEKLYEQAEEYANNHADIPNAKQVFPNPLYEEYRVNSDAYSEKEQEYIEKMDEFINSFQRVNVEEYEVLKQDLKEELHIKDSYNPFD